MKTQRKVLAILLSLVMVFSIFTVALVPATAAGADTYTGKGVSVSFVDGNGNAVDFLDPSSGTYFVKLTNESTQKVTSYSINTPGGVTLTLASGAANTIDVNGTVSYQITGFEALTENTGAERDGTAVWEYYHVGDVYDFSVTYTLECVTGTFVQPAYIGAWNTADDSYQLEANYDASNRGVAVYYKSGTKNINASVNIKVDENSTAIITQTSTNCTKTRMRDGGTVDFQLFVDSSLYTSWQDIGLKLDIYSWSSNGLTLNPGNENNSRIVLNDNGAIDMGSAFSLYLDGGNGATDYYPYSPIYGDANVIGTDGNGGINYTNARTFTGGNGQSGNINSNSHTEFPFVGTVFKTDGTKKHNDRESSVDTLIKFTGQDSTYGYTLKMPNNGWNATFYLNMYIYAFDKTNLRTTVRNLGATAITADNAALATYKEALRVAASELAAQKTDQYKVDTANTNLSNSFAALAEAEATTPVFNHDFTDWTEDVDAGTHTGTCSVCGDEKTEEHNLTYTDNGENHTKACTVCDYSVAENHNWGDGWTSKDADKHERDCALCERHEEDNHDYGDGWTSKDDNDHERDCVVCEKHEEDKHNWVAQEGWVTPPTCTVDGTKHYVCSECSAEKNAVVADSALKHNYDGQPWYDGKDGNHYRDCKNGCDTKDSHAANFGDVWTDNGANHSRKCADCTVTETADHSYTGWTADGETHTGACVCGKTGSHAAAWDEGRVTKEATTTETGERTYTCDTCGLTKTEEIPMVKDDHEHNFEGQPWVSDGNGSHYQECVDGDGRSDLVACTEGEGVQTLAPTCGAVGTMTYSCAECGYVLRTADIGKLPHAESAREVRNARDAKCEVTGYTGDVYCKDCDTLLESGEEIAALEHSYANKNIVDSKAATCNENGYVVYTCDNGCGKTTKVTTLPTGKHIGGTATCSAKAVCEVCGNEYGKTDPNNHNLGEWKVVKEPTCKEAGQKAAVCADCDLEVTEAIPTLSHVDNDGDGICDYGQGTKEEHSMPGSQLTSNEFRCSFCDQFESKQGTGLAALFRVIHAIIHYISYLIYTFGFRLGK